MGGAMTNYLPTLVLPHHMVPETHHVREHHIEHGPHD
jgi:hypothetical protein